MDYLYLAVMTQRDSQSGFDRLFSRMELSDALMVQTGRAFELLTY
jgi:hypothetical protein